MDSSLFELTMTMPGDARLVGAVRDLAAHAAKYAQLPEEESVRLAAHAADAAAASIEGTGARDAPIEIHIRGDVRQLDIRIAADVPAARPVPPSAGSSGVTVDWSRNGVRQVCLIAHRPSS